MAALRSRATSPALLKRRQPSRLLPRTGADSPAAAALRRRSLARVQRRAAANGNGYARNAVLEALESLWRWSKFSSS
jgi:hypothetical protein